MKNATRNQFVLLAAFFLLAGVPAAALRAQCPPPCLGGLESVTWNGWQFDFVRPCLTQATTAGGRGGGIEIQNATYNGRLVFFKAHLPILNVKYQGDLCGPFRDWQFQESRYECVGDVVSAGRCNGVAVTNCNNPPGGDVGTFCGVTVDESDPNKLVLTSLIQAGWYRYQLEWHFFLDGSFRPAIRWTAVPHPCLQNTHIHFAYWRIDFDIEGATPNTIEELKNPLYPPLYWETWDPLFVEMERAKDPVDVRGWRVRNSSTGRGYTVHPPNPNTDGVAIAPQINDIWALRYNNALQEETDDCAGPPALCSLGGAAGYWSHLTRFIDQTNDPNYLIDKDVVFWYAASHQHEGQPSGEPGSTDCDEINGPTIAPDPEGLPW